MSKMSIRIAALGLISATPAFASPESDARIAADAFGTCAVERNADAARAFVMAAPNDTATNNRFIAGLAPCSRAAGPNASNLAVSGAMLQQVLANALVRREFASIGPTSFAAIARISSTSAPIMASEAELAAMPVGDRIARASADTTAQTDFIFAQVGECVARLNPEGVRTLSQTVAASAGERAAVAALTPQIANCLPEGATMRIRPAMMRGWAILQYYRLAHTPPTETAATQGGAN